MSRAPGALLRTAGYWIVPPLVCLLLYWRGFRSWFRADDFAWLGVALDVHSFHDFLAVLFAPAAQGTIRPWSETGFFLGFYKLFGLNALPFRIVIFGTQFANLALMASIGTRLAGMRAAGLWAALFWVFNGSLVEPLGWACTYNQVMCGCFLLLAFHFLLRHIATGEKRFYVYQWITFLVGFGAMEINVVYPVLAAGYTWLCARKYFRRTLPLAIASALYMGLHLAAAPAQKTGPYAPHLTSTLRTLGTYWTWSVGPTYLYTPFRLPAWLLPAAIGLITAGLAVFLTRKLRERNGAALFCLLWYLATIAPVLPFRDHITEYYVFLPVIALCWLGGWAFAAAWHQGSRAMITATVLAALYIFMGVPEAVAGTQWNYKLTMRARTLVEEVARVHRLYPRKAILLEGVDFNLFWNTFLHRPFRLVGADEVYLATGSSLGSTSVPDTATAGFGLPADAMVRAIQHGELVIYNAHGEHLLNMTSVYSPLLVKPPRVVDVTIPLNAYLLGPEWYGVDEDHRWMPKHASLHLAAPERPGEKLYLHGGTSRDLLQQGPVVVTVAVNGMPLPQATLRGSQEEFELWFPLPDAMVGQPIMNVTVDVSRTIRIGLDQRELGLHFGVFEVR